MDPSTERNLDIPPDLGRRIGSFEGERTGSLVLCVGGIHGNERAGVLAALRVLTRLAETRPDFRGRFTALAGNLAALARNQRYVRDDLNRHWDAERLSRMTSGAPRQALEHEDREMSELLDVIREELEGWHGPCHFLDLHTNSGGGPPFVCIGDTLRNRDFALQLGLPIVLGLEEQIDGALLEYVNNLGHVTVGVEGGGHSDPASVDHHEAVIWMALFAAGNLRPGDLPDAGRFRGVLARVGAGIPRIVEVRYRHLIRDGDGFEMNPGYCNFQALAKGEAVASDRRGPIRIRERCRLLLPLYQSQGDDGFFTVRAVSMLWLKLSRLLRWLRADGLAPWLPGVRRHPARRETLVIDTRVARFFPLQVFHLLGFRKQRWMGKVLLVSRRRSGGLPG